MSWSICAPWGASARSRKPADCRNVPAMFCGVAVALHRWERHLYAVRAGPTSGIAALTEKCAWKGKIMAAGMSSEKVDLLIYGPTKPIVEKGFSDQFVLHPFET